MRSTCCWMLPTVLAVDGLLQGHQLLGRVPGQPVPRFVHLTQPAVSTSRSPRRPHSPADDIEHRSLQVLGNPLGQKAYRDALGSHDLAAVRRQASAENAHKGGFTHAVSAQQADPLTGAATVRFSRSSKGSAPKLMLISRRVISAIVPLPVSTYMFKY
jgi:hypothetical protein